MNSFNMLSSLLSQKKIFDTTILFKSLNLTIDFFE
jgi:hypothetical protein